MFQRSRKKQVAVPVHRINNSICAIRLRAECLEEHAGLRETAAEIRDACRDIQESVEELARIRLGDTLPKKHP